MRIMHARGYGYSCARYMVLSTCQVLCTWHAHADSGVKPTAFWSYVAIGSYYSFHTCDLWRSSYDFDYHGRLCGVDPYICIVAMVTTLVEVSFLG